MSAAQSILQTDPYYRDQRRRELQSYLDLFSKQLYDIVVKMPAPKRIFNLTTGEWSEENDPEWQALIDRITNQQQEHLQSLFPEFYPS